MRNETELNFFMEILTNSRIPCQIVTLSKDLRSFAFDLGLRKIVFPNTDYGTFLRQFFCQYDSNIVYKVKDSFQCRYYSFRIPDAEDAFMLVGPCVETEIILQDIMNFAEQHDLPRSLIGSLERIYRIIPIIPDNTGLLILLTTLGQRLWGGTEKFSFQDVYEKTLVELEPVIQRQEEYTKEQVFFSMKALEKQYDSENSLMQAVARGDIHTAEMLLGSFPRAHVERRTVNSLRDYKNYAIIANTLLRKAAEQGSVHPLHLDQLSSRFARLIENAASKEDIYRLTKEMARKYCLLVKNHSLQGYSPLVRSVLVRIGSDLTADLSLKTLASYLNVSPSYLSSLFKKETGSTLTDYVNRKRAEYGVFLLNSTSLQVQTIACHCGISDLNYFTRTFKKYIGITPTEYRNIISSHPGDPSGRAEPADLSGPRSLFPVNGDRLSVSR